MLLRRHFREPIQPQVLNEKCGLTGIGFGPEAAGGEIQAAIGILQLMLLEPFRVFFREQGEVVELVAKFAAQAFIRRQGAQPGRAQLLLLQFLQLPTQFLGKAGSPGAASE